MKIPEDEKIRLAFEERAFHFIDPDFRKDEVWQKIQMRLNSTNNKYQNKYTITALILLFFTLSGWMITFHQYSQLEKKKTPSFNSGIKLGKQISVPEILTSSKSSNNKLKEWRKRTSINNKGSNKPVMKKNTEDEGKLLTYVDTIKKPDQTIMIAELHSEEKSDKMNSLKNLNQGIQRDVNYIFSYKNNLEQKTLKKEIGTRKLKIQFFTQEPLGMNSAK